MEFADQMRNLAERAFEMKDVLNTEEATKNALIMPFINSLGYDVFNPTEVIPEFTADVGIKKRRKGRLRHPQGWQPHHHRGM